LNELSLFSGAGGGLLATKHLLGWNTVGYIEINEYCQAILAQRIEDGYLDSAPIFGNIKQFIEEGYAEAYQGMVDVITAGFPCQPFSISGVSKRKSLNKPHGFRDRTKGTLFFDISRILDAKRPRAFLLENVKHLKHHDKGRTYKIIRETLVNELGYDVHDKVIDARYVVPQHRERVFIAGFKNPLPFKFPEFKNRKPRLQELLEKDVDSKYTLTDHLWDYLRKYAAKHRAKGNGFGYGLASLNGVTRTLSARYYKDGSEILIPQEGKNPRRLTPRECARLMGFPDSFKIPVSDTQAYRQFGNSVVVPIVEKIAEAMIDCMLKGKRLDPLARLTEFI